jgi:hypothetical protein
MNSGINSTAATSSGAVSTSATSLAATIAMAELQHEQQLIDMTAQRDTNAALVQDLQAQLQAQVAVIADQNASVVIAQNKTQRFEADNHGLLQKIRNMDIAAEQTALQHDAIKSTMIELNQQLQVLEAAAQRAKESPDAILVCALLIYLYIVYTLYMYIHTHSWHYCTVCYHECLLSYVCNTAEIVNIAQSVSPYRFQL